MARIKIHFQKIIGDVTVAMLMKQLNLFTMTQSLFALFDFVVHYIHQSVVEGKQKFASTVQICTNEM